MISTRTQYWHTPCDCVHMRASLLTYPSPPPSPSPLADHHLLTTQGHICIAPLTDAIPHERVRFTQAFPPSSSGPTSRSRFATYPPDATTDEHWARYADNPLFDLRRGGIGVPADAISIAGYPYKTTAGEAAAWTRGLVSTRDARGVEKFLVTLEMFWGVRCLNSIRKALDPARYPEASMQEPRNAAYIRACVEHLREVIMCTGRSSRGTGLITYQWSNTSSGQPEPAPYVNGIRQCQDPEKVLRWALERTVVFGEDGVERPRPRSGV